MLTRTQYTTLVFRRSFPLKSSGGLQAAGTYTVETEEELLDGLSFPAYRRVSTTIRRQASGGPRWCARRGDPSRPARAGRGAGGRQRLSAAAAGHRARSGRIGGASMHTRRRPQTRSDRP